MIVHLYRESILNIFNEIRNDTAQKKLNVNLSTERIVQRKTRRNVQIQTDLRTTPVEQQLPPIKPTQRKHLRNVRCQTDFVDSKASTDTASEYTMSLDERIKMFETNFRDESQFSNCFPAKSIVQQNRFKETRKRRHSSLSLESPHSSIDSSIHRSTERTDSTVVSTTPIENSGITAEDSVAQEMMALFGDDEETDIFGEVICTGDRRPSAVDIDTTDIIRTDNVTTDTELKTEPKTTVDYTNELKNSIWPCELHMQRMKLHKALMKKADKGFRYSEKLRRKFDDLFGPDDDDEDNPFVPYR